KICVRTCHETLCHALANLFRRASRRPVTEFLLLSRTDRTHGRHVRKKRGQYPAIHGHSAHGVRDTPGSLCLLLPILPCCSARLINGHPSFAPKIAFFRNE